MNFSEQFPTLSNLLNKVFGKDNVTVSETEQGITFNKEVLSTYENTLKENQDKIDQLSADVTSAQEAQQTAEKEKQDAQTAQKEAETNLQAVTIAINTVADEHGIEKQDEPAETVKALGAKITELGKKPGDDHTQEYTDKHQEGHENEFNPKEVDHLGHNQLADQALNGS